METPLIEFKEVTKRFDSRTVLDQVNLKIYENQITMIMGKSGTGKSVLLKHIIGLLSPDAGTILFMAKKTIRDMVFEKWQSLTRTACDFASPEEINKLIKHESKSLQS